MRVVFVHGACVKDGTWWWSRAAAVLESRNVFSTAPALPGCGESGAAAGAGGPGLRDDVAAVRAELQRSEEPTVVVAHSYGGIVVAEAAAGVATVRHLLLISSYLPEPGESLSTFSGPDPAPFLEVDVEGGTFAVRPEMLAETFMHDSTELVDDAARRLARQSLSVAQQPVNAAAWQQVPTTYVVCVDDRGTPAERQRTFSARPGRSSSSTPGTTPSWPSRSASRTSCSRPFDAAHSHSGVATKRSDGAAWRGARVVG